MGLIDWKPSYRVMVDGKDITSVLAPRLSSLVVADNAGVQSDTVDITLTDTREMAKLEIPAQGAELRVAIGYQFGAKDMGLYIADSVEVSGPPDQMRIHGTASVHGETTGGKSALTEHKTRSWPKGTTIREMAETIAGDHGLEPAVSDSLADVELPHIDQIDESDINLISRVARDHDAIAKPGGGKLVVTKRGESRTVSGDAMPTIRLALSQVTRWRLHKQLRAVSGRVVAIWRDKDANKDVEVTAGNGTPERRLNQRFATRDAAQKAADSEYQRSQRAGTEVRVDLPGDPDLVAEARLILTGFRPGVNGEWLIKQVQHKLDSGGYRSSVTAEPLE